jgi:hypothetical protein
MHTYVRNGIALLVCAWKKDLAWSPPIEKKRTLSRPEGREGLKASGMGSTGERKKVCQRTKRLKRLRRTHPRAQIRTQGPATSNQRRLHIAYPYLITQTQAKPKDVENVCSGSLFWPT